MLIQTIEEHTTGPLHGFFFVDVRCGAEGGEHVKVVDHTLAHIAMQIVRSGHQTVGADDLACGFHPVALCVLHPIHEHGSMHGKKYTLERKQCLELLQKVRLDGVIGSPFDRSSRHSLSHHSRNELCGILFQKCESLRARKRLTLQDFEVFYTRPDAAIGATFNPNAAKGYTWLPHTGVSAGESITGEC